jgi:hypothetical protein
VNRNKLLALLVLILVIGGIGFWIVWGIMLNKGTIVFNFSRPPYTAAIGEEAKTCLSGECEFWIPVGPRTYTITKDGYFEKTGSVNIIRDKKITENISLEFIPQSTEGIKYQIFKFPAGYSKFLNSIVNVSLFAEFPADHNLKSLPKVLNNIVFSGSGNKAVLFEDNKVSLYSTRDFTLKPLDAIKDSMSAVFSEDEAKIYAVSYDEASKKYALKKVYINEDKSAESLIYFGRDVKNYELSISPDETRLALADKTFSPEILYILDLQNNSRTNVFEGYMIENGGWSNAGEIFIFKAKNLTDKFSGLYFYNFSTKSTEKLTFEALIHNFDFVDGQAFFVTSRGYYISSSSAPYAINFQEQAAPTTYEEIVTDMAPEQTSILVKWDIKSNTFYLIKDLTGLITGLPEKIELSEDGTTVRMLIAGQIYDIKIQE